MYFKFCRQYGNPEDSVKMWNQKKNWENFSYMVFWYCQDFVCSSPEFILKIYYQNVNLGITVPNSKIFVVIFSRNIQLSMSTSIVTFDQAFGMMHHFRCNHIPFTQLCHDGSIPQFVCDLSYFLVDSKFFTSMKFLFTISFSTEEAIWNDISQINVATIDSTFNWIRLRRVFRCITNIERFSVFLFSIQFLLIIYWYTRFAKHYLILYKYFDQVLIIVVDGAASFQLRR